MNNAYFHIVSLQMAQHYYKIILKSHNIIRRKGNYKPTYELLKKNRAEADNSECDLKTEMIN